MPIQIDRIGAYFTQIEIAEKFDRVRQEVQYWIEKGYLPAIKMVGGWAVHEDDLAAFTLPKKTGRKPKVRE
jgi:hypothetical protein